MESRADWSDTPPDQVGPPVLPGAVVEDDEKLAGNLSSGLSDVVDGIDLHVGEDDLLNTPPPSVSTQDTPITTVVSIQSGLLPTGLPPTTVVHDNRVRVPEVPMTGSTSNDLDLTSNDIDLEVTLPPPTTTSTTTSTIKVPSTTPQIIWSHTRPNVMANLQANRPSLAAPVLIGPVSDYAASIPLVDKWKYIPNSDGIVRMPPRMLEQHIRQRLSPSDRTKLQMSAHRKFSKF